MVPKAGGTCGQSLAGDSRKRFLRGKLQSPFSGVFDGRPDRVRRKRFIGGYVTAIGLISAIYVVCLFASGLLVWPVRVAGALGYNDARRALLAIYRATGAGLVRCLRATLGAICLAIVAWAFARLVTLPTSVTRSNIYQVGYSIIAELFGAAAAIVTAYLAVRWAKSATLRTVVAAFSNIDRLLADCSSLVIVVDSDNRSFRIRSLRRNICHLLVVAAVGFQYRWHYSYCIVRHDTSSDKLHCRRALGLFCASDFRYYLSHGRSSWHFCCLAGCQSR